MAIPGDEATRSIVSSSQGVGTKLSLSGVTQGSSKIDRTEGNVQVPTKFLSWSFRISNRQVFRASAAVNLTSKQWAEVSWVFGVSGG